MTKKYLALKKKKKKNWQKIFFDIKKCLILVNIKNSIFLILFRAKNEVDTKDCAKKNEGQKN